MLSVMVFFFSSFFVVWLEDPSVLKMPQALFNSVSVKIELILLSSITFFVPLHRLVELETGCNKDLSYRSKLSRNVLHKND